MLLLASTSPFRRQLLARLELPFDVAAPRTDETPEPSETPTAMVQRLAEAKARAVEPPTADTLVIGADQCADIDGTVLGKPGSHEQAAAQLRACSGRTIVFHTGLCLLNPRHNRAQLDVVDYQVTFRELTDAQIEAYLRKDRPYGTAGSVHAEGLGIALFQRMAGDDPTALIGLPLIRLTDMLQAEGVAILV